MNRSTKFFSSYPSIVIRWNSWHIFFSLSNALQLAICWLFFCITFYIEMCGHHCRGFFFLRWGFLVGLVNIRSPPHPSILWLHCIQTLHPVSFCINAFEYFCVHFIQRKICASFPVDLVLLRMHSPLQSTSFLHLLHVYMFAYIMGIHLYGYFFSNVFFLCVWWDSAANGKLEKHINGNTHEHMETKEKQTDVLQFWCKSKIMDCLFWVKTICGINYKQK